VTLSPETLLATAQLQIELLNNQLHEANLRNQNLQGEIDRMKRSARLADQARRAEVPSLFGGVTEAA
jgi:cell division protein FtsL